MELRLNLPFSETTFKICGVYKLLFDDGSFYIGSSLDLRSRASSWGSEFKYKIYIAGKEMGTAIVDKIKEGIDASFEIVELCYPEELRDKEAFYLDSFKDSENMLSSWDAGSWKPVLQYTDAGVFVKRHMSISGAARYMGCTTHVSRIQKVLTGARKTYKGMTFIFEKDYHQRRVEIIKERYTRGERKNGRSVAVYKDGEKISVHHKITDAAKSIDGNAGYVRNVLRGIQRSYKGYIFQYE